MRPITEIMTESRNAYMKAMEEANKRAIRCRGLLKEDFIELLTIECEIRLFNRELGGDGIFNIDESNSEVINQLYLYLVKSNEFKGNFDKGIILQGPIGSGKTILLRGFAGLVARVADRYFEYYSAFDMNKLIAKNGTDPYSKRPLLIDDLGKEQEIIKEYGTDVRPILELFAARYDTGAITFITTNYDAGTFANKYGKQTVDRFIECFNFIVLKGASRRK